jgi:hypothetical protein
MEFKKELEKLKSYLSGHEVIRFKTQYKFMQENFMSEAEQAEIDELIKSVISDKEKDMDLAMDEVRLRIFLIENKEIIPVSYIAETYFKKSKNWLYQKINGNLINGKPAKFSAEEIQLFNSAIRDIGKKLGSIA